METLEQNVAKPKTYGIGLDIVRIIAMFLVVSVHATSFYGFTQAGINSFVDVLVGAERYLSFTCVPLFIVLTGYLTCKKTPTFNYYVKIIKVLIEFCLCGIIVASFYAIRFKDPTPISTIVKKILYFSYPGYSWYIKMYVGLFLLAPFLNYILNAISKKQAIVLIVFSVLIFAQPNVTEYWQIAYPLMYYFIGGILRIYPVKIKKYWLIIVIVATCFLQVLFFKYPLVPRYMVENYNNIGCAIITVSVFLLFYDLKFSMTKKSEVVTSKITRTIANASMSTFLISEIFEALTSTAFNNYALITFAQRLPHLLYLTPLKFIASVLLGIIINVIATLLFKLILNIGGKIKMRFQKQKTENNA